MGYKLFTLMAAKLAVAETIESTNFSDEGLAAMGSCDDLSTVIARELSAGIREETVDVRDAFRQMANLHPVQAEANPKDAEKAAVLESKALKTAEPLAFPAIHAFDEIWQPLTETPAGQISLWELAG